MAEQSEAAQILQDAHQKRLRELYELGRKHQMEIDVMIVETAMTTQVAKLKIENHYLERLAAKS